MAKAQISMKLLIDKNKNKVLFAEAGKECVDFFFHMLSLPLGTVVGYLTKASMVGSIGSLYGSLERLGNDYLEEGLNKDCLLKPKPPAGSSSKVPLLAKPDCDDLGLYTFFTCIHYRSNTKRYIIHKYVSDGEGAKCPECNELMNQELKYVPSPDRAVIAQKKEPSTGGGYVKGVVAYMIMDDLSVHPMSTISSIYLINKFNVQDVGKLEEREVFLDINLGVTLMEASLKSKTVLTDVFLGKKV